MIKHCIYLVLVLVMLSTLVYGGDYSLPYPPPEFFVELANTEIPRGQVGCCQGLRAMLEKSVMIPAPVAVELFRQGKIFIGDARTFGEIMEDHILGALLFPHDRIDFMDIKPINMPIALY